jgi:hypothetical protein
VQFKSSAGSPIEILFAKIRVGPLRFLAGVVYRPPASWPVSSLLDFMSQFCPGYDYIIVMGDFNIDQHISRQTLHITSLIFDPALFT